MNQPPTAREAPWARRLLPAAWFLLACLLGALAPTQDLFWRLGAAVAGGVVATLLAVLWGPRTRPAMTWRWSIVLVAGVVAAAFSPAWVATGLAAAGIAFYLLHDHPAGPGAILLLGSAAILWQPSGAWTDAGEAEAWWLGGAMCAVVIAAILERERLAAQAGTPTAPSGSVARVAWVAAWTAGFLWLRESLPLAAWVGAVGLDVTRTPGRVALVALLLLATAAAGLLLRDRRRGTDQT